MARLVMAVAALLLATGTMAQTGGKIATAIGRGDATALSAMMNSTVQLKIESKSNVCSKTQTEHILQRFFEQNPPSRFTPQTGGNGETVQGTLETEKGTKFSVFILTRPAAQPARQNSKENVAQKRYIQQIRIENGKN